MKGEGIVQAFCGSGATERRRTVRLRGLDAARTYRITDWDNPSQPLERTGAQLLSTGLELQAIEGNQALVFQVQLMP